MRAEYHPLKHHSKFTLLDTLISNTETALVRLLSLTALRQLIPLRSSATRQIVPQRTLPQIVDSRAAFPQHMLVSPKLPRPSLVMFSKHSWPQDLCMDECMPCSVDSTSNTISCHCMHNSRSKRGRLQTAAQPRTMYCNDKWPVVLLQKSQAQHTTSQTNGKHVG